MIERSGKKRMNKIHNNLAHPPSPELRISKMQMISKIRMIRATRPPADAPTVLPVSMAATRGRMERRKRMALFILCVDV